MSALHIAMSEARWGLVRSGHWKGSIIFIFAIIGILIAGCAEVQSNSTATKVTAEQTTIAPNVTKPVPTPDLRLEWYPIEQNCVDQCRLVINSDKDNFSRGEIINFEIRNEGKQLVWFSTGFPLGFGVIKNGYWTRLATERGGPQGSWRFGIGESASWGPLDTGIPGAGWGLRESYDPGSDRYPMTPGYYSILTGGTCQNCTIIAEKVISIEDPMGPALAPLDQIEKDTCVLCLSTDKEEYKAGDLVKIRVINRNNTQASGIRKPQIEFANNGTLFVLRGSGPVEGRALSPGEYMEWVWDTGSPNPTSINSSYDIRSFIPGEYQITVEASEIHQLKKIVRVLKSIFPG